MIIPCILGNDSLLHITYEGRNLTDYDTLI